MDDSFNSNELSAEDLAVLQAFEAMDMDDWEQASASSEEALTATSTSPGSEQEIFSPDDMLALFVEEVNEDMTTIRRALQKLEPDETLDSTRLRVLQRGAHKIKGTAGAVGCTCMSSIARHMEDLIDGIIDGIVVPFIGLNALAQTVHALELTLKSVVTYSHESPEPLAELEAEYQVLEIDLDSSISAPTSADDEEHASVRIAFQALAEEEGPSATGSTKAQQDHPSAAPFVRIDPRRLERLVLHSEQLAELSAPLQNAQAEVERALQELHAAQARLRQLEVMLSNALSQKWQPKKVRATADDERPTSSLVARILHESGLLRYSNQRKSKNAARLSRADESLPWDELEMDNYTENDVLVHTFNEAIADVATASTQLRLAFDQLRALTQKHIDQANNVRNDTLLLRLAPISTLLTRIERAITMSAHAQQREIQFVVEGETTEIDQDTLEELKHPLLQLVRTCLASGGEAAPEVEERGPLADRAWLYVRPVGNEVTLELGFSQAVGGGAVEEIQEALRHLHGSISVGRNTEGGISFHLRLPRSQGAVQSLLVRVGDYRLLVPFSQVQRIDYGAQEDTQPPLALGTLLGFAGDQIMQETICPVLVLQPGSLRGTVQVDEVLGEVELVVKPLAPHVRRPGITSAAIDGMGNVLLMIDVFELIRYYDRHQRASQTNSFLHEKPSPIEKAPPTVLIADDSVYMRRSLQQTLQHAGYQVLEARDGMEALEILLSHPPRALLLDLEMPNLNGYDLLSIMRAHGELAQVKIVMLTSRSSDKHKARAFELGAHGYLTKPCAPESLLVTLKSLLDH